MFGEDHGMENYHIQVLTVVVDLVLYEGHVAMLTGNGTQIVHAAGRKYGIIVSDDYRRSSSHAIRGIMRVKGVD